MDYYKSLDCALTYYFVYGDVSLLDKHAEKFGERSMNSDIAKRTFAMKTITSRDSLPLAMRVAAKKWLDKRGLRPLDDDQILIDWYQVVNDGVKRLAGAMLEEVFGSRCPDFDADCECCRRWRLLDDLTQTVNL